MLEAVDDMPGYVDDVDAIIINTAIDIEEHSTDERPLTNIVYLLATEAVQTVVDEDI
jgi:hypothetical protein